VPFGAILGNTLAQEGGSGEFILDLEALATVEPGQMAERNAVTLACWQLSDERPKKARPNLLILKAGIDVHATEHEVAVLVCSPNEANRALIQRRDIDPIGRCDARTVAPRLRQLDERRIIYSASKRDLYINHCSGAS
jgi:hypothetical protein